MLYNVTVAGTSYERTKSTDGDAKLRFYNEGAYPVEITVGEDIRIVDPMNKWDVAVGTAKVTMKALNQPTTVRTYRVTNEAVDESDINGAISGSGGSGGGGDVSTVNGVAPDGEGNVQIAGANITTAATSESGKTIDAAIDSLNTKIMATQSSLVTTDADVSSIRGQVDGIYDQLDALTAETINITAEDKTSVKTKLDEVDASISSINSTLGNKANTADVVPPSRTINGVALTQNVVLTADQINNGEQSIAASIDAIESSVSGLTAQVAGKADTSSVVPITRAVNGKALSTNITITAADTGAATLESLQGYVPNTRKVAGKQLTADITLAKADVGLGNVDNTSDADKPISTATQAALNAKANTANVVGLTGDQTIAGTKTFSDRPVFSDGLQTGNAIFASADGMNSGSNSYNANGATVNRLTLAGVDVDQVVESTGSWVSADTIFATTAAIDAQIAKTTPLDTAAAATKFTFNNQPIKKIVMRQIVASGQAVTFNIGEKMQANEYPLRVDVVSCPAAGPAVFAESVTFTGVGTTTVATANFAAELGNVVVMLYADVMLVDSATSGGTL